jgi:RNA polymerase sigma factor (sigma-70 family)
VVCRKGGIIVYQGQKYDEPDVLRARFTKWLEKLIKNARIDYLRQLKNVPETISIDSLFEDEQLVGDSDVTISDSKTAFDFEEERLAKAFYELPLMKRRILEMLFVEEIKPEEIAKRLNCSAQYVYNQRLRAIKKLREQLNKGGVDV